MSERESFLQSNCPDCGVAAGKAHGKGCDIERCSVCGRQRVTCDCDGHDPLWSVWTGQFPLPKDVEKSVSVSEHERVNVECQQCYYNAFQAIMYVPEFAKATYVEGIASINGLNIEHGWIEFDEAIVDPTLPSERIVYFPGLRFVGQYRLSMALRIERDDDSIELPIFYRFGWGGAKSPEFCAAREASSRFTDLLMRMNGEWFAEREGTVKHENR